jgi:Domain of unknown function (DUF4157)/Regulator of G protein signaling domain
MTYKHLNQTRTTKTNQSPQTATNTTSDTHPVLQMQADIGNRATSQILSSQKPIQAKPLFGGLSSELSIQPKLTIGAVGDKYEQEADTVASQVVNRMDSPVAPTVQRKEMLPEDEELMMKPTVQRYSDNQESVAATPDLEASIQQSRGGGEPLPDNIRQPMEQEFGADFSAVKVHANSQADKLNSAIQAKAFTTRQDIFFKQGEYSPNTRGGKELLAHELTHVMQQNGGQVQSQVSREFSGDTIQRTEDNTKGIKEILIGCAKKLFGVHNNSTSTSNESTSLNPNDNTEMPESNSCYQGKTLMLNTIMQDEKLSKLFQEFCKKQLSENNFLCFQQVDKYLKRGNNNVLAANWLIEKYVMKSDFQVNIDANIFKDVLNAQQQGEPQGVTEALKKLHRANEETLMDTFSRFTTSESLSQLNVTKEQFSQDVIDSLIKHKPRRNNMNRHQVKTAQTVVYAHIPQPKVP